MATKIKFKTRCVLCGKYDNIKYGWRYCSACTETNRKRKKDD